MISKDIFSNTYPIKKLGEVVIFLDSKRKPVKESERVTGIYPYYGANGLQGWINDYIFDDELILLAEDGGHFNNPDRGVAYKITGKTWVNNHAHIIEEIDDVLLRYLFHYIQTINISKLIHGNIPKLTGKDFKSLQIPVPPLPVQYEIVRILDTFSEYTTELTEELTMRKKQYEYYRDSLLSFGDEVEWKKIKDVFQRIKGTSITASKMKEIATDTGEIRIFAGGKTVINAKEKDIENANITKVPSVLVQSRGIIDVLYYEKPFTFKNEMWAYTTNEKITVKYLYYILKKSIYYFRNSASSMGSLPQISLTVTEDYKIPLPPLEEQKRIVDILDRFDTLCNDISKGLPAEIEARKKQYEYYRDKLLDFKNINEEV